LRNIIEIMANVRSFLPKIPNELIYGNITEMMANRRGVSPKIPNELIFGILGTNGSADLQPL
jgi:hypothetical protein